jgi:hypothetical protein
VTAPRDTPPPPGSAAPDVGRLIGERYRLGELLGIGGMATVHRALDTRFGRAVAVKLLRREVIDDTDIAMRFRREALAATVLRHPNIVACLEAGTDDGQPYLVMDLIEGEDLAARLKRVGRLEPAEAVRIGLDVARGLAVAHARGIVHRDVKPGNILLARDGRAMVTDFGIARLAADAEGAVPGTTLGSVQYFSPEQAGGGTTTAASDVYSLGLVLYEALTGQRAWHGDTTAALAAVRIGAPAPSPRAIRPDVPAALDAIVVRALDPDPDRRFANGGALEVALETLVIRPDPATATTLAGPAVAPPLAPTVAPAMAAGPPADGTRPWIVRRPSPAVAGPLAVLLGVLVVVGGAMVVAGMPRIVDSVAAIGSPTPRPTPRATPTARPTPKPTPTQTAKPTPKPTPAPTPRSAPTAGSPDLCDPIFGLACGLDAGRYAPARFEPAIRFDLRNGWSTVSQDRRLLVLGRDEGTMTFASGIAHVYPSGDPSKAPGTARNLVETFIVTDGVASGKPVQRRVDKRRATVVDLWPSGNVRIPLFDTGGHVYFLEASGPTRVIVVDGRDGPLIVALEASDGSTLDDLWPAAEPVLDTLRFR